MPNVQQVLTAEIRRLARKEVKAALAPRLKADAELRKKIAEQEKRITALEKAMAQLLPKREPTVDVEQPPSEPTVRITKERIKKLRLKLELSQAQFATLLGVNLHSVNHWECGQTSPREAQKRRIAAVRDMGRRELRKLFEEKSVPLPVFLKSGKCPF